MTRSFAALALIGLGVGLATGGPAPAPLTPAELVARLGSDDFPTREAAVRALEKCGPEAIPALRAALRSDDPEVRQRAAAVLTRLQRAADSAGRLAPKRVALDYTDVPLGTAINDLRSRTGLNVTIDPNRVANPLRKVTCATGEVPVWEALDLFCAAAGLKEDVRAELDVPKVQQQNRRAYTPPPQIPAPDAVPVVLIDGKGQRPPGDRRTAVRVVALPASFPGHRVTLGTGEVTFCFEVAPAPGLNWVDVSAVKVTKLIDDAGRFGGAGVARPAEPGFVDPDGGFVAFGGLGAVGGLVLGRGGVRFDPRTGAPIYPDTIPNPRVVEVPLKVATPTARTLKRLEGVVLGEITLTNQTLLTLDDPTKNVGTAFSGAGDLRLTVLGATETKTGGTSVQLLLQYPSPWSANARRGFNPGGLWPEAPRSPNQSPAVQAFDAAGKALTPNVNTGYTDSGDDGLTMHHHLTLSFRKGAAPAKFVVVGPRPLVVEVPFVMENVPLP